MIEILLPVYNGEKYLGEQIDSIINQSYKDWIIKIRNDGSKDGSQEIIDSYCKQYPDKIIQIKHPEHNIGLVCSLNVLLENGPHCNYIMFSDQDDVWFPEKIEKSLNELKKIEREYINSPIGVCCDAQCVDENLNIISPSFFESQKFSLNVLGNVNKMMALNIVQGSTVITNRVAKDKYYPFPEFLNVHDMWLSVIIAHYGKMCYHKEALMAYRQHQSNVLGEINIGFKYYINRAKHTIRTIGLYRNIQKALGFKTNFLSILFYKLLFAFYRISGKW